ARAEGFPLVRHSVFFNRDYADEFGAIFKRGEISAEPTVYVCAQDRLDGDSAPDGPERMLILVNAPADGDKTDYDERMRDQCTRQMMAQLSRCGLQLATEPARTVLTTPKEFAALFPATGGALYGRASHGWQASFKRPDARTKLPGLYLAGGSIHPGAGVPMAALSGRLAAASLLSDCVSTTP
ncbi:MAG: FAD-dependent oxidoreductase, partial [Pseudomonadota bacterium]